MRCRNHQELELAIRGENNSSEIEKRYDIEIEYGIALVSPGGPPRRFSYSPFSRCSSVVVRCRLLMQQLRSRVLRARFRLPLRNNVADLMPKPRRSHPAEWHLRIDLALRGPTEVAVRKVGRPTSKEKKHRIVSFDHSVTFLPDDDTRRVT